MLHASIRTSRTRRVGVVIAAMLFAATYGVASAEVTKGLSKKLTGRILVTDRPLPQNIGDPAEAVAEYNKLDTHALSGQKAGSAKKWSFYFTAFMKRKPRTSNLALDFYTAGRKGRYVTSERFMGVDPQLAILAGHVELSENDGLKRGTKYRVVLTGKVRGREVVFAKTTLTMK